MAGSAYGESFWDKNWHFWKISKTTIFTWFILFRKTIFQLERFSTSRDTWYSCDSGWLDAVLLCDIFYCQNQESIIKLLPSEKIFKTWFVLNFERFFFCVQWLFWLELFALLEERESARPGGPTPGRLHRLGRSYPCQEMICPASHDTVLNKIFNHTLCPTGVQPESYWATDFQSLQSNFYSLSQQRAINEHFLMSSTLVHRTLLL